MTDLEPKLPSIMLGWSDVVLDLQELLEDLEVPVYLVGGAVRDAFLRRPVKDLDLITPGSGLKLARMIANRLGGAFYPLDSAREVGRTLIELPEGRLVLDVARFRGDDLRADLEDRDFTINAIAVDLRGDLNLVIDPLGGVDDLKNKVLRRCSPESLENDPVRALRALRQSVQFKLRIEPDTLSDVRAVGSRLLDTSVERVRDELFKMLALPKPAAALRVTHTVGLLSVLLPEFSAIGAEHWQQTLLTIERLVDIFVTISPRRTDETAAQFSLGSMVMALDRFRGQLLAHTTTVWADDRTHQALLTFTVLFDRFGIEIAEAHITRLHLSNAEKERVIAILRSRNAFDGLNDVEPVTIYRFWKRSGKAGVDVILLSLAEYLAAAGVDLNQDVWLRKVERARALLDAYFLQPERYVEPPILLNGNDLMKALGVPASPLIGALLEVIREGQVNGTVVTVEDALNIAREHLTHSNGG
jgi:tRNA nucleotidyltransferase/poly(A) polymerase